ncbi:MAG: phage tail protein [Bryobacteraceae bacterium]
MPQVADGIWESLRASEFVLVIDGHVSPGVSKISGLSEGEVETVEQPDGGTNHVYKIAGNKIKFEPLTIERYVDQSPEDALFRDWFRRVFDLNSTEQGGSSIRRNGMIIKRHNGKDVMHFSFKNAWIKSSKFTDLEAGSTAVFKQTIVLEHEGLRRED